MGITSIPSTSEDRCICVSSETQLHLNILGMVVHVNSLLHAARTAF
jgi:hypothetical protein